MLPLQVVGQLHRQKQRMKTRIIYSVGVYQLGGGDSVGQGEGSKMKATKTSGGGDASPSYNPPKACNISSLLFILPKYCSYIPFELYGIVYNYKYTKTKKN